MEIQKRIKDEKDGRKHAKMEEAQKKEKLRQEAEEFKERMRQAADFYNQQLLIKYGIIPFANMILELRFKET